MIAAIMNHGLTPAVGSFPRCIVDKRSRLLPTWTLDVGRWKFDVLSILVLLLLGSMRVGLAESLTVNPETTTYDYYPSASALDDGSVWLAWHGYRNGRDQVIARHVSVNGDLSQLHTVNENGAVHGPPTIIADSHRAVSVVWTSMMNGRWTILLRQLRGGRWVSTRALSDLQHDAIYPTAKKLVSGGLLVVWSEFSDGKFQIRGCQVAGGQPSAVFSISSDAVDAFRPVLVTHGDDVWAIWDQCRQRDYSVHARRILPEMKDIEQVSPRGEFCLTPTAISHDRGLYVGWLRKVDVIGGQGVISQWHTLHAALRGEQGWKLIETASGETTAAELTQGLMAQIEPRPIATGGYLGPRTRPLLMSDGEQAWLLWERKSNHRGSTPTASGELVGRQILDGQWHQDPVVLSRQRIDYHLIDPPSVGQGGTRILASRLPHQGLRRYELFELKIEENLPFQQDTWTGWTRIELPIQGETTPRRAISANGKTYKLYWGDLHCHNALTADAEGEPDEMHVYARDRAELDVVVFTNNDFYNVPLTQYEFELGSLFARVHSAKDDPRTRPLLSLPGFEWTSRIPGVADALLADSGNWLPPYQNRSYPNHRSVIYPPSGGPLVHFTEVGNDISRLNEAVQKAGGVTLSQHNAFKLSGHRVEVGLELTSGWSNYIASHPKKFHDPLNRGAKLGFTANGDTHRRAPGLSGALTGIYAESLSADAILDALRSRRCFATMGSKIFVDARADDSLMGQTVTATDGQVTLALHAIGTRPITAAILVRDGKEIRRIQGNDRRELTATVIDKNLTKGTHWYYWRISQARSAPVLPGNLMAAHGHLAWSTPNWVVVE